MVGVANEHKKNKADKVRLEDQPWYHGTLPRQEIAQNLQQEGQFLVRTSTKATVLSIVISVKADGKLQHFVVGRDVEGWRLEGSAFPTIVDLIQYHLTKQVPLTQTSGALLKTPVKRHEWLLRSKDVTIEKVLGHGQFGEVCAGKIRDPDNPSQLKPVAIKKCTETGPMSDEEKRAFLQEAKLMLSYNHKNVVRIFGVACDKPPIMIVMELCENGALDGYLRKNPDVQPKERLQMCFDAARGMEYLHTRPAPCVHRDLAARNCLISAKKVVKISDFGMSREGAYSMATKIGKHIPVRWTAPEALQKGFFNTKTDVYSFGILLWEIYSNGKMPWAQYTVNKEVYKIVKKGNKMENPAGCPTEIYTLMCECWNLDAKARPTFVAICKQLENITRNQGSLVLSISPGSTSTTTTTGTSSNSITAQSTVYANAPPPPPPAQSPAQTQTQTQNDDEKCKAASDKQQLSAPSTLLITHQAR